MAWPPAALPTNRTNTTVMTTTHPADHNAANLAINDLVTHVKPLGLFAIKKIVAPATLTTTGNPSGFFITWATTAGRTYRVTMDINTSHNAAGTIWQFGMFNPGVAGILHRPVFTTLWTASINYSSTIVGYVNAATGSYTAQLVATYQAGPAGTITFPGSASVPAIITVDDIGIVAIPAALVADDLSAP